MNTFWDDIKAILSRPTVILVILVVLSLGICGIYAAESTSGPIHIFQNACSTVVAPFSKASIFAKASLFNLSDKIFDSFESGDSVSELKAENARLKNQIIASEKYKKEAERLEKLLQIKDQYNTEGIAAHVMSVSSSAWNQMLTLSSGSEDGISAGQTVLGANGVIGQIDSTGPYTSTVRLLSDPNSGVAVKTMSSGCDCILKGSLDGILYLEGVDVNQQLQVGDIVVTSGLGGSYIEGLTIGSISQIISNESGVNRKIVVSPIEQNSGFLEVYIIKESR